MLIGTLGGLLAACGADSAPGLPIADAGFDQRTAVGVVVTLDGSNSHSQDGTSLSYAWRRLVSPQTSAVGLAGAATPQPTFTADVSGQYLFELVVAAGSVLSEPDVVSVVASAVPPVAVAKCSASDCRVLHGRVAGLLGSESYDPDSTGLTYLWQQITTAAACDERCPQLSACDPTDQSAPIDDATAADTTFTAPDARDLQLVFELVVADQSSSASACLAYRTTNTPPIIASVAGTPATVDEGTQFALIATTGDSEQDALSYAWEQLSGVSAGTLPAQEDASVTAPFVGADTFLEFRLVVSDGIDTTASDDVSPYAPGKVVRINVRNVN